MSKAKMRTTTSFLKTLSRLPTGRRSATSTVAPLPEQSRFSEEITAKVDTLRSSENDHGSASWLVDVLDAAIDAQKVAQEHVINNAKDKVLSKLDMDMIDAYLEDNIELLDACNGLVEKADMVHNYVHSLQAATRVVEAQQQQSSMIPSKSDLVRVRNQKMFNECNKLEAQCVALDKVGPKLCKLMGRKEMQQVNNCEQDVELHEVLSGSREVASMGCHILQRALSFKSRQGLIKMNKSKLPTTWSSSLNQLQVILNEEVEKRKKSDAPWMMNELEKMVMDARVLQGQVKCHKGNNVDIESLRRSCEVLEEGVKPLEEKVQELYRHLISFRMVLLGIMSRS